MHVTAYRPPLLSKFPTNYLSLKRFCDVVQKFLFLFSLPPRGFDPRSLGAVGYEADAFTIRPRRPTTKLKFKNV